MLLSGPPQGFGRIRPSAEIQGETGTGPPIKTFGGDNFAGESKPEVQGSFSGFSPCYHDAPSLKI